MKKINININAELDYTGQSKAGRPVHKATIQAPDGSTIYIQRYGGPEAAGVAPQPVAPTKAPVKRTSKKTLDVPAEAPATAAPSEGPPTWFLQWAGAKGLL